MIAVLIENGDVLFFNEKEHHRFVFNKEERTFHAYPIQPNASVGIIRQDVEVEDVIEVLYTNERQPTELIFRTDE